MTEVRCFISYSWHQGQKQFAHKLAARLKRYKDIDVWIDEQEIIIGSKLYDSLERGISKESDIFIPILSPEYLTSENCNMELKYALKLFKEEKKPVFPIILKATIIPMILQDIVWADFRKSFISGGGINENEFQKALINLVKSIRSHKSSCSRIQKIKSSGVNDAKHLWIHLFKRVAYSPESWLETKEVFASYLDIVRDRKFEINPVDQFMKDLKELIETNGYLIGNNEFEDFSHMKYQVINVPSKLSITENGRLFLVEAKNEYRTTGI